MGFQDRIRESLTGSSGGSDPPEYGCNACRNRFNSNRSPRHARCPECDSGDVKLLANPDRAEGSHPLDPRSDDDSSDDGVAASDAEATASETTESADDTAEPSGDGAKTTEFEWADEPNEEETDEPTGGETGEAEDDAASADDDESAMVRELMQTGQYRCRDCREAFDQDGPELVCPDCGSTDIKERF